MKSFVRLIPYIWLQRKRLLLSSMLGIAISLIWTGGILMVFPVVKVLLEQQSLGGYVATQLQTARQNVHKETERIQRIDLELANVRDTADSEKLARLKNDRLGSVRQLNEALWREWEYSALESRLLPYLDPDRFTMLSRLLFVLLIFTALKCTMSYFQEVLVSAAVERMMQTLRLRLFRATLKLDQQTLGIETTPQLMSRFTFDMNQLSSGMTLLGSKAVIEPLKAIVCIACAFSVNWRLTALSFVCAPVAGLLFGHLGKRLKRASRRQMESMSRVYRALIEPLQSFNLVLAYRNERLHRRRLAREHRDYYDKAMKIVTIDALSSPSIEFLAMVGVFIGSLPGAYLVLNGETSIWGVRLSAYKMDASELALLYTLLGGVLDPARRIASIFSKVKKSGAACDRIFDWMDCPSLLNPTRTPVPLPRHRQKIEFQKVTFRYAVGPGEPQRAAALDDVSVSIPFGATVAVVGGNGSGKSTLVSLLPRLFDPQEGSVRIDDVDISRVDLRELRQQIGVVSQDTLLFDTSIEDNIRYGFPQATPDALNAAARCAHVLGFANQMPDGLRTSVGDRGHRLSGGQRQRVALARAILRDPAILILDEATSAVDVQSEQLIYGSLGEIAKGRTTFIVTHAMTPILLEHISHVLVLDHGRVVAFGAHEVVLNTCPAYQRLFDAQIRRRVA